jgi:hypothetical protein
MCALMGRGSVRHSQGLASANGVMCARDVHVAELVRADRGVFAVPVVGVSRVAELRSLDTPAFPRTYRPVEVPSISLFAG